MPIDKKPLINLPYVTDKPNPVERPDQKKIQWVYNGECLNGAESKGDHDGQLNRTGVQIQENITTNHQNGRILNDSLSEVIDQVNKMDIIIGEIGDVNLTTKVNEMDIRVTENTLSIAETDVDVEALKLSSLNTSEAIGAKPSDDNTPREIYPDITWIKKELGSWQNVDFNGVPTPDPSEATGMKYRFSELGKAIGGNDLRITAIEEILATAGVDEIEVIVQEMRAELGAQDQRPLPDLYTWANTKDHEITTLKVDVNNIKEDIMFDDVTSLKAQIQTNVAGIASNLEAHNELKTQYEATKAELGSKVFTGTFAEEIVINTNHIKEVEDKVDELPPKISAIEIDLGSDDNPDSIKGKVKLNTDEIVVYKQHVADLATYVGANTTGVSTGLTLRVKNVEDEIGSDSSGLKKRVAVLEGEVDKKIEDAPTDGKLYGRQDGHWVDTEVHYVRTGFNMQGNATPTDCTAGANTKVVMGTITPIGHPSPEIHIDETNHNITYTGTTPKFFQVKINTVIKMTAPEEKLTVKLFVGGTEVHQSYRIPSGQWVQATEKANIEYSFFVPVNPSDSISLYVHSTTTEAPIFEDMTMFMFEI